ncbi:hypothetical protein BD560DRAFT_429746 [Blakeslea trispora]|nr:hypothetical protein BD560DRAFT_429746 [Blakeslea trispora]
MLLRCVPLMLRFTGLVLASATARLLLFRRTSYSRLGMRSTGFLGYYDAMVFWSYGLLVIPLFTTRPFFFLYFFMILVTLISRSPCCSSSESGSQARQECKSWYVTYISDFVTLKAVILSTWFTSSGYSFVSNAILLIFEITLQSGQKWSFGIFCLCSGPSGIQDLAYPLLAFWRSGLLVFWFLALVLFGDLVLYCAVNRVIMLSF